MSKEVEDMRSTAQKKSKKSTVVIIILLLIIVIGIGIAIFLLLNRDKVADVNKKDDKREVLVTEDNVDAVKAELASTTAAPDYTVTMNNTWNFSDGASASSNAYVGNDSSNLYDVYFEVNLEDTDSTLVYSSPIIPIGSKIQNFSLDKDLDAGTYSAIITYYLVDENQNEISNVAFRISLVIEN